MMRRLGLLPAVGTLGLHAVVGSRPCVFGYDKGVSVQVRVCRCACAGGDEESGRDGCRRWDLASYSFFDCIFSSMHSVPIAKRLRIHSTCITLCDSSANIMLYPSEGDRAGISCAGVLRKGVGSRVDVGDAAKEPRAGARRLLRGRFETQR